ncbi:MAG: glycosyltransferase family 1 protein [Patescibacteria group bacterium]
MKIGIDIRTASHPVSGKAWYTFHVVRELLQMDKENEYTLYTNTFSSELADLAGKGKANIVLIHKHPLLWHWAVVKDFRRRGGEVFFAPTSFIIPALLPKNIASVITVHDLIAFTAPERHQAKARIIEHLFLKRALKKTVGVLVPSEHTKKDLMRLFHYPEEKITVTPLAAKENQEARSKKQEAVDKYQLPEDFILTVGGLQPRKNIIAAVEATEKLRENFPQLKLVIVGGRGWKSKEAEKKIHDSGEAVIHIEHVLADELAALYQQAKVFVYPSLYEGFGLPPLEAMAHGCPVVCSNRASLPEVCGDAALLVNPQDTEALTDTIARVLKDETLRTELRQKGLAQAKKFSWRKTAQKTLEALSTFVYNNK